MIQNGGFHYHHKCSTCSHCKGKDVAHVSTNGETLWCKKCYQEFCMRCYYCKTPFQSHMKCIVYKSLLGKVVCESCSSRLKNKMCFTCNTKISDQKVYCNYELFYNVHI